jgi:hypothetical protein
LRETASWIPIYRLHIDQHGYLLDETIGSLPKGLVSEKGIENTTIFNVDFACKENPVQNFRNNGIE